MRSDARKRLEGRDHWEHPDAAVRELIQRAKAEALRVAADEIEAEARKVSGTGHLRAWWVITRLRQRANALTEAAS